MIPQKLLDMEETLINNFVNTSADMVSTFPYLDTLYVVALTCFLFSLGFPGFSC
jgi:hypothetical protein